ncbi:MAG: hypothetical protein K2H48_02450 [Duncaniella sp.]|nr:hypothetical protein [Duncaniella sp.]
MFNAATKTIAGVMLAALVACSGDNEKKLAQALYDQAEEAIDAAHYSTAVMLIDSLKTTYPRQIDIRRRALHLTARAGEGLALQRLQSADSLLAAITAESEAMKDQIKQVDNPVEKYYVAASAKPAEFIGSDGLQARLSPDGQLYIISSLGSRKVKSTAVAVESTGERAETSSVAHDGERNDRSMGAEVITFMGVECDSLANFIAAHAADPITLTFMGEKNYSMTLPKSQAEEIAVVTRYATLLRRGRAAVVEKEKQQRILDTARSQAARTFTEEAPAE